jgi:hypothetical protein
MSDKVQLLAGQRQKGESRKAVLACNDYLRMGLGRRLVDLHKRYHEDIQENSTPTRSWGTLTQWSSRYNWQQRADEYDAELERQKNERRQQVMNDGLALDFERVDKLKALGHFLLGQIYEQGADGLYHNVWLPDVKQIGSGEFAERIDIERFNAAIIGELRGVLDDLAKETGGRTKRHARDWRTEAEQLGLDPNELFERVVGTIIERNRPTDDGSVG